MFHRLRSRLPAACPAEQSRARGQSATCRHRQWPETHRISLERRIAVADTYASAQHRVEGLGVEAACIVDAKKALVVDVADVMLTLRRFVLSDLFEV